MLRLALAALMLVGCGRLGYPVAGEATTDAGGVPDAGPRDAGHDAERPTPGEDGGGARDAGPDDGGPPPVVDPCDQPGMLFCDPFDVELRAGWTIDNPDGELGLVPDPLGSADDVLVVSLGTSGRAYLRHRLPTAITTGPLYVSFRLLLAESTTPLAGFLVFSEMREPTSSVGTLQLLGNMGDTVGVRGPMASFAQTDTGTLPRGRWVCAQAFVDIGVEGTAWGQIERQEAFLPRGLDTTTTDGYRDFYLGLATDDGAHVAYFDDFYLGTEVVGCAAESGTGE